MKLNNASPSRDSLASQPHETTEMGAISQKLPGFSGRKIAWCLGSFMLVSLILIPAGLFLYQGVSDREKQIQRDWPKVAAALDGSYALLDTPIQDLPPELNNANSLSQRWRTARQNFRSRRLWFEQLEAAQVIEDLLNAQVTEGDGVSLLAYLSTQRLNADEQIVLGEARLNALKSYDRLESEQLAPYRSALTQFPTKTVLLFFRLPEPPVLQSAQPKLVK